MKQTINFSQFHDAFRNMDRLENFSYQGLRVLYDWFEMIEDCDESEVELDVIAICCEFSESTPDEIIEDYSLEGFREDNAVSAITGSQWRVYGDRENDELIEYLNERTMVCGQTDTTIVYAAF